MIKIDS